jgi:hypothetical protein
MQNGSQHFKPNLLAIAPPYGNRAPAGSAYLLGYLKANGCHDFDFLDLRLWAPFDFTPTYRTSGAFGESFALDTPDLPLILQLLSNYESGKSLYIERDDLFERYCIERAISPHYLEDYLAGLTQYYERCLPQVPNIEFIGFSTWTPNFLSTLMAAANLKRREKPPVIIAGGPQVTASKLSAELALRSGLIDLLVLGEGEQTLLEVYTAYCRTGAPPQDVPGTAIMKDGAVYYPPDRKQLHIYNLPAPSFDEMPLQAYQNDGDYRSLPFQLSRGCTDKCSFCSEWVFWKHFRSDVPDHAVEQIGEMLDRYNAGFIEFSDSLLNGHQSRLEAFAEGVLSRGIEFGWTSFMRAQMDPERARLLKRSGCSGVFIGIESFSDEALKLMNKRRTEADNIQAVIAFVEAGIHVTAGFIPGFPGDTREGFLHSVKILRQLQDRYPGFIELHEEPFTVMANAPIAKNLEQNGLAPVYWDEIYLDINPKYKDACASTLCGVTGNTQGMERLGRTKLVGAVKTDAPVKGTFDEGYDEVISLQYFEFTHITGPWSLAFKKTMAGHRYGVIVNEEEMQELIEIQNEHFPLNRNHDKLHEKLKEIESMHVISYSHDTPHVERCLYKNTHDEGDVYAASPFILARQMDWRNSRQVLTMDTTTHRSFRRNTKEAELMALIHQHPASFADIKEKLMLKGIAFGNNELKRSLHQLCELGVLTVCDMAPVPVKEEASLAAVE